MPDAEPYAQLTRYMPERCDAMAKDTHYRKGAPIGGLFAEEKAEMQPLPSKPYDAIRWEAGKADKDGRVQVDGNHAGPSWRGWTLDVGLRAFERGDPHPGRAHLRQAAARVRGFACHYPRPRHAPARTGPQDPRMARFHHPR